ncbi:biopolymer transporter ExbD [uncultured Selenomonas sp.]|uniref:ExbD/TolR family protein n=1 Tax=uncultured Selenomonas sp. TaxID=159275 RepID=UPI0028DB88A2|nr:biopolymer transporter ExbD [uncultured Selenomonas sp.]
MRLRDRRAFEKPEVMIIPMIDIMFFLLVFFIMSTLYMVNLKTVDVNLPKAQTAQTQLNVTYLVTVRKDGSLWLEDKQIDEATLLRRARAESQKNQRFAVVVRADGDLNYSGVMELLDKLRKEGITRFGLAAE